ncbi:MAG: hypothetical protein WAL55_11725 [Candidatus Acidiferrales bacterium]
MGKGLGASQSSIGRSNWAGCGEHGAVAIKHHEGCVLVGQPAKRSERNKSIGADDNETAQSMTYARQAGFAPSRTDAVVDGKVSAINVDFNAVTEERYNSVLRHNWCEIAVLEILRYGLRSCHWSLPSLGG